MTDIAKLKQETEEARKVIEEKFYQEFDTRKYSLTGLSAIAEAIIDATIKQIALQAAEKEAPANIEGQIIDEIYKACELLGAKSDLLGTIGSWRDTMSDEYTLDTLKLLNEHYSNPAPIADDGWIKWEGGECPGDMRVLIKYRDGKESKKDYLANNYFWRHDGTDDDIIAYRIVAPAADRVSES